MRARAEVAGAGGRGMEWEAGEPGEVESGEGMDIAVSGTRVGGKYCSLPRPIAFDGTVGSGWLFIDCRRQAGTSGRPSLPP